MGLPALRGLLWSALCLMALVLCLGAIGSPIATAGDPAPTATPAPSPPPGTATDQGSTVRVTLWYSCTRQRTRNTQGAIFTGVANCVSTTDAQLECGLFKERFRAAQAFTVVTIVVLIAAIALGLVDHIHVDKLEKVTVKTKFIFAILWVVLFVVTLCAWAICMSLPNTSFCGSKKLKSSMNYQIGACPVLLLVTWFLEFFLLPVAVFLPPRQPNEPLREAARPTHGAATKVPFGSHRRGNHGRDESSGPNGAQPATLQPRAAADTDNSGSHSRSHEPRPTRLDSVDEHEPHSAQASGVQEPADMSPPYPTNNNRRARQATKDVVEEPDNADHKG